MFDVLDYYILYICLFIPILEAPSRGGRQNRKLFLNFFSLCCHVERAGLPRGLLYSSRNR
jgi:hypothetical protein